MGQTSPPPNAPAMCAGARIPSQSMIKRRFGNKRAAATRSATEATSPSKQPWTVLRAGHLNDKELGSWGTSPGGTRCARRPYPALDSPRTHMHTHAHTSRIRTCCSATWGPAQGRWTPAPGPGTQPGPHRGRQAAWRGDGPRWTESRKRAWWDWFAAALAAAGIHDSSPLFAELPIAQASSCDTACVLSDATADGGTLFLKNSDRHVNEESEVGGCQ
jgi:hypothetical protein